MAPPANSRTNWPVQLPPTVAKNALGGDKKALGRRVFDSPLIGRSVIYSTIAPLNEAI